MERIYYVYVYLDPRKPMASGDFEFEPFYVGKGKGYRASVHLQASHRKSDKNRLKVNRMLAIEKATGAPPPFVRFRENLSQEEASKLEVELIAKLGRLDKKQGPLTNLSDGGDGCAGLSERGRKALSEKMLGAKNPNADGHVARGVKRPGQNNGKTHTQEAKTKVSIARALESEETKRLRSESFKKTWQERRAQWCKKYEVTSPFGEVFLVSLGLEAFAKEHGLCAGTLVVMLRNPNYNPTRGIAKDWKIKRLP